jgi:hypothetical protein
MLILRVLVVEGSIVLIRVDVSGIDRSYEAGCELSLELWCLWDTCSRNRIYNL